MPNWWHLWAERIAAALAELWLRSGGHRDDGSPPPTSFPGPDPPTPPLPGRRADDRGEGPNPNRRR